MNKWTTVDYSPRTAPVHISGPNSIVYLVMPASDSGYQRHDAVRREFRHLADWWHIATDGKSSAKQKVEHEAYRRVVEELGEDAIPCILEDLRDRNGHWFGALRELTNTNVSAGSNGDLRRARRLWLRWGEENELI